MSSIDVGESCVVMKNDSPSNGNPRRVQQILVISDDMMPTAVVPRTSSESSVSSYSIGKKKSFSGQAKHTGMPSLSSYLAADRDDASAQEELLQEAQNQLYKDLAAVISAGPIRKLSKKGNAGKISKEEKRPTIKTSKSMELQNRRNGIPRELSFHSETPQSSSPFRSISDGFSANHEDSKEKKGWIKSFKSDMSNQSMLLDDVAAAKNFDRSGQDDVDDKSTGSMPSLVSFLGNSFRSQASSAASAISNKSSACSSAGVENDSFSTIPSINTMKTFASSESCAPTVKHRNYTPGAKTLKKDGRWECEG